MSKPSETDKRYQRYADYFGDPETAGSVERGHRVMHWEACEARNPRETVAHHARTAQRVARIRESAPVRTRSTR